MEGAGRYVRRKQKRSKNKSVAGQDDGYDFSLSTSRGTQADEPYQDEEPPSKRRKTDNLKWMPIANPINEKINQNLREYEKAHCECNDTTRFCFACETTGYNLPYFSGTQIQELIIFMYTELRTASMDSHCIAVYERFENTVRKPINAEILAQRSNRTLDSIDMIPEWLPSTIKEHIESHHIDPEVQIELMIKDTLSVARHISNTCIFKKAIVRVPKKGVSIPAQTDTRIRDVHVDGAEERQPEETPQEEEVQEFDEIEVTSTDQDNFRTWKDAVDLTLKLYKSNPQKMLPYYTKDKFIVEQRAGHPFFHLNSKKIVAETPFSLAKDKGFRM